MEAAATTSNYLAGASLAVTVATLFIALWTRATVAEMKTYVLRVLMQEYVSNDACEAHREAAATCQHPQHQPRKERSASAHAAG